MEREMDRRIGAHGAEGAEPEGEALDLPVHLPSPMVMSCG